MYYCDIFGALMAFYLIVAVLGKLAFFVLNDLWSREEKLVVTTFIVTSVFTGIVFIVLLITAQPTAMELHEGKAKINYVYEGKYNINEPPTPTDSTFVYIWDKNEGNK